MSVRNIIQTTFDEFGKASGGSKKSGSWYWRSPETIAVLNLQKSQYAVRYYVNVALWLLAAGPADAPKPSHCHIQTRLERLVPPALEERLTALLDLDSLIDDEARHDELLSLLREYLLPTMEAASTLEGLRSGDGQRFVNASLVDGDGQRLLAADK
jgi:hypothetical protein